MRNSLTPTVAYKTGISLTKMTRSGLFMLTKLLSKAAVKIFPAIVSQKTIKRERRKHCKENHTMVAKETYNPLHVTDQRNRHAVKLLFYTLEFYF